MRPILYAFATICTLGLIAMVIVEFVSERPRREQLAEVQVLHSGQAMVRDQLVAVQGTVAPSDETHGLVVGVEQYFTRGKYGGWQTRSKLRAGFGIKLEGNDVVLVEWPSSVVRGALTVVQDPNDKDHRWKGLRAGDRVCCVGVVPRKRLTLNPTFGCHGGSLSEYRSFLVDEAIRTWSIVLAVYAVCGLFVWLLARLVRARRWA